MKWGDGDFTGVGITGKYQNHKPRCQGKANEELGVCAKSASGSNWTPYYGYACAEDAECSHIWPYDCLWTMFGNCDFDKDGDKNDEDCLADRFGDTSAACIEGYFTYDHVYNCTVATGCTYKIGVQVKDNWGWCNGNHVVSGTPGGDGKDGFYADGVENDCAIESDAKEYYDGYIYVSP